MIDVLDDTAARHRAASPDLERLASLKSRLRYDFLMAFDTADHAAQRIARPLAIRGDLEALEALHAAYAAVHPEDVQSAADTYLRPERRTVGVLRGRP